MEVMRRRRTGCAQGSELKGMYAAEEEEEG